MPNPTLIKKDQQTIIVFADYLQHFDEKGSLFNNREAEDCDYSSIFFYNADKKVGEFYIPGADLFIGFDQAKNEVMCLANDEIVKIIEWGTKADNFDDRTQEPTIATKQTFELLFGESRDLSITKEYCKRVETHVHNEGTRFTLIYHGVGSFTFEREGEDFYNLIYLISSKDVQFISHSGKSYVHAKLTQTSQASSA